MPRDKLAKLQHELNTEPRKHDWLPYDNVHQWSECARDGCGYRWCYILGQPEPVGCTGTDPEGAE